jgi:hypothetical protein
MPVIKAPDTTQYYLQNTALMVYYLAATAYNHDVLEGNHLVLLLALTVVRYL